jgi:hypothetical protein
MDKSTPPSHDPELSKLLQAWQIEARDDPALPSKVWRRLEAARQPRRSPAAWLEDVVMLFARPLVAVSTVALFTATGATLAFVEHAQEDEARFEQLTREYVRSIDPVQLASFMPADAVRHQHP